MHRIEWVMDNTDPALFGWEIDILHNWSGRVRFLNATTHQPDISVWELAQEQDRRVLGWHIKDGFRNTAQTGTWVGGPPESGGAPYFQTFPRTRDVHRRDRVGRGRPGRGARAPTTRTPIRTAPASSTCSRTWAGTSAST